MARICCYLMVLSVSTLVAGVRPKQNRAPMVGIQALECSADPQLANDTICTFRYEGDAVVVTIGANLLQPQPKLIIRTQQFIEMVGTNNYQPYGVALEINICDLMRHSESPMWKWVSSILPNYKKALKTVFHPCPFEAGPIGATNLSLPLSTFRTGLIKGKLREVIKVTNDKRQKVFELKTQVTHI